MVEIEAHWAATAVAVMATLVAAAATLTAGMSNRP